MADIVQTLIPSGNPAAPGDYSLMSAAESTGQSLYGDLVADGNTYTLKCYAGTVTEPDAAQWVGWVTNAASFITIEPEAGNEHNGVVGAGCIIDGNARYGGVVLVRQPYTVLRGISVHNRRNQSSCHAFSVDSGFDNCVVARLILTVTSTVASSPLSLPQGLASLVKNCLAPAGFGRASTGIALGNNVGIDVYSNTINNCVQGITNGTGAQSGEISNNLVYDAGTCFIISGVATGGNNASSDGTAFGTSPQTGITTADFSDYAGGDYSPASGGKLDGTGADLSTDFTTDIAGATRTVPWTIGAWIVAGGPPPVGIQEMYIKDGGIFVKYTPYVKVGGTFQEVDAYVLEGGTWKPVHEK